MTMTCSPLAARRGLPWLLLTALVATSCSPPKEAEFGAPKVLPKDSRPTDWALGARDRFGLTGPGGQSQGPSAAVTWVGVTPAGWQELPPQPERFRNLLYRVAGNPEAECYLTVGVGGGIAMNLRRWYVDQAGKTAAPAPESLPEVEFAGRKGRLVELTGRISGKDDAAMLIVFAVDGDRVTTLRMSGPAAVLMPEKDHFLQLAKSLRPAGGPGSAASDPAASSAWSATVPAGWEQLPPQPNRFRELLFRVAGQPETECYLTSGVGGGATMNLERWYVQQGGQAKAPSPESLPEIEFLGAKGRLVEISGTIGGKAEHTVLIAMHVDGQDVTTLRFQGPSAQVLPQKPAFLALAASVRRGGGTAGAGQAAAGQPAASGATAPSATPTQPPPAAGPFTADVPAGWTRLAESPRLLHHSFGSGGEVYVAMLGGAARQNLDVWRGEVAAKPLADEEYAALPKLPMLGGEGVLMDVGGDFQNMSGKKIPDARLLVAAHDSGGTITFVKLVGPAADVAAQFDAFSAFCASLRRTQ